MTEMSSVTATNIRYRINISTTSKGLPSIDCTVDGQNSGVSVARIEAEAYALVRRVAAQYPAGVPIIGEAID
jgi:dihydroorotate dehydrogenase